MSRCLMPDTQTNTSVSVLDPNWPPPDAAIAEPDYFGDLNLDQVEHSLFGGRDQYRLVGWFRARLTDPDAVRFRQGVFRDVEKQAIRAALTQFAEQLGLVRKTVGQARKLHYAQPARRWFLNAVQGYCHAVRELTDDLTRLDPESAGLRALRDYLHDYAESNEFSSLVRETESLLDDLGAVRYELLMRANKLTVAPFDDEADYSREVLATFERFRQGDVADHHAKLRHGDTINHVEVAVLDMVAQLFPDLFARLERYCDRRARFVDGTIARADRELQFYLAYLDFTDPMRSAGLSFCYPDVSPTSKVLHAEQTFDLALAAKLITERSTVVPNDLDLDHEERILVVSGPNNGGKTTLARTFGQLYHLAALGCPVPGSDARIVLPDAIFAHFEREEDIETLSGKLADELNRIHAILEAATADSVIILNEIFNSTTVQDAAELSRRVLTSVSDLDALAMCVTFIDELSTLNEKTVSMVSTVDATDPAVRTFRVVRRPADGRAYALAIAEKYRLTYDTLKGRLA